jgi:MOSC domain-containing protein YiiM
VSRIETVNVGAPRPNPHKRTDATGIDKRPVDEVQVRDPGPKQGGLGSGIVGDYIGDKANHGGADQALYAYAREDLDRWQQRLGRTLSNGFFGENLTTSGLDLSAARLGEQWRIGDTVVLQVTAPRIPCTTFRGWVNEAGWLRTFTLDARPGAYFRIVTPGMIRSGDLVEVIRRPAHEITISLTFRALTTERYLRAKLAEAGDDLPDELREELRDVIADQRSSLS